MGGESPPEGTGESQDGREHEGQLKAERLIGFGGRFGTRTDGAAAQPVGGEKRKQPKWGGADPKPT